MVKDEELAELAYPEYWDRRYLATTHKDGHDGAQSTDDDLDADSFEWFRTFDHLRPFLTKQLPEPSSSACHILHLGCGNSTLTADLHALGYHNQTSVDFSRVVIAAMQAKYAHLAGARWRVMDVRELELPDACVDVAIDKSTLDAMIHGSLWDPPDDVRRSVRMYVDEVFRVLQPGGQWLYITYRQPHFMKPLLARDGDDSNAWTVTVEVLQDPDDGGGGGGGGGGAGGEAGGGRGGRGAVFEYFGYVMSKRV
ncbi:MAG: hypothetical protein M1819_002524 [Sarea resinae]|nr:MAG: hypothetical protein M1819_002524 [Sarea resinae]